jgi:ribosomal-protein-alanine N-acetyltransferase
MSESLTLRRATEADAEALIAGNRASVALHHPWVEPFVTPDGFERWFAETRNGRKIALLAECEDGIVGVINLNEIVRGIFRSAYLGYYGMVGFTGRGLMTRAVGLALSHAFTEAGLHRIEANIQPANLRSRALVQRLGFRLEGFSPRYLHINGAWRDHERWARLSDE